MVNTTIVSRYSGTLPSGSGSNRKIQNGPLYPASDVLPLLGTINTWTKKCGDNVQRYDLDSDDLSDLLKLAVQSNGFKGSEWCKQNPRGPWAACDSYVVFRDEWIAAANKNMEIEYYIKFAISKTGSILLLVSCHT